MILITHASFEAILSQAAEAHLHECCGLLLGEGSTITHAHPTANVHSDPATHFEIDPAGVRNSNCWHLPMDGMQCEWEDGGRSVGWRD